MVENAMPLIVYFDGECLLCNRFVHFLIKHDKGDVFRFSTVQDLNVSSGTAMVDGDTVLLEQNGRFFEQSEAVLRMLIALGGAWKLFKLAWCIPAFLRNWVYRWVARNRFRIFGRTAYCSVMSPALRHKFIIPSKEALGGFDKHAKRPGEMDG